MSRAEIQLRCPKTGGLMPSGVIGSGITMTNSTFSCSECGGRHTYDIDTNAGTVFDSKPLDLAECTVYGVGLCFASVCTRLDDAETAARLNVSNPTGLDHGWTVHDEPFADGSPNPTPCPDDARNRHVLFSC